MTTTIDLPTIRPYQAVGIDFLIERNRAALFDEPGVGKSMQALLSMRDREPRGRILVVCTGDALGLWQEEIRFWLDEEPGVYAGVGADPDQLDRPHGFVITNYHRLPSVFAQRFSWDGIIFDESQMLRNRNTRTLFKAVRHAYDDRTMGLSDISTYFLSGTPVVKSTGDLWPILHLIDRKRYSSYWTFVKKYAVVWHDNFGSHVEGSTNVANLWLELEGVALRRLKKDVQPELPPKIRQRMPLTMTPKQAKAYRELERDLFTEVGTGQPEDELRLLLASGRLPRDTRLRQLLVSPRLIGIDDDGVAIPALTAVASESRRPFVIYTPFAEALPILAAALMHTGRPIYWVQGGMGLRFHQTINLFRRAAKAGEAPILASTIQMGKSWSVSDVTYEAYMLGIDWNATTIIQAEDRLARHGQLDTVFIRFLCHTDTIDMDQLEIASEKKRLADVLLDRRRMRRRGD